MNFFQRVAQAIIRISFYLSVWVIKLFSNKKQYQEKRQQLDELPAGTLGKDISTCLQANKLDLIPGFGSHDLKHVLLGFKMTALDEIRLQAFMLGNGNITFISLAIFIYGALLLPGKWKIFYQDFKNGRNALPIASWTIEEYGHRSTSELRALVFETSNAKVNTQFFFAKVAAYAAMIARLSGMLYCLPFLFSASVADLVGAGFPFVGGAVLAGAGLIALSNLAAKKYIPAS
ncbi:hypothetical protein SAMN05660909_04839 [Chitinophaga terrae (ex Kim and Jung 2007)]|uniref:Uncharacterized protein n=1 Tax=Chitinophaga terrae (ex Kim and Jung 2007) TaxID=408074 RepID=A0A1H4G369_9BACT|nr:hypothetical protein [Chitinophaga terrae (ex Kim and Jung 2007)]GEP93005.1 hypothetical protein CTE07_46500 [Chitinophaga terrae (ex Kim and Jung 2007)]SEB03152.1 hypothetical protein SAMN05660909_04839 [Chitinophaga terrae (ex Kim and Jung 2007)]